MLMYLLLLELLLLELLELLIVLKACSGLLGSLLGDPLSILRLLSHFCPRPQLLLLPSLLLPHC